MNITLIGMPGSGKTFVGNILAGMLDFEFFDSDAAIEFKFGCSLPEILKKLGEKKFLEEEEKVIISVTSGKDKLVISPGGSIVYSRKAMEHLKKISTVVYLKTALPVIKKRIGSGPRAIIGAKTKNIAKLYAQRLPLYEKWTNITVDGNQTIEKTAQDILKNISNAVIKK